MAHRNCFKNPNDNLNSGQYIDRKKSKTIYKASVDLANNGGVYHKKGPLGQNKGTYVGDVNISRDGKKCLIGANSYETLLSVTNGKYLEQPVSFDIRDSQELWSGSIYKMDMDSNISILSHPDGSANTFSYPPGILANQTYPLLNPPSDQGLIVDPCYTIFYPNTPGFNVSNSSGNCYTKNERAYQQYRRPIVQSHSYIKNYIKSKNGYVGDYYYPKPFSFDCCSNFVENIYNPTIVPPLTLEEKIIMITNSQAVFDIFVNNIPDMTSDKVIKATIRAPTSEENISGNVEYVALIIIEDVVFDDLTLENKNDIINELREQYATDLGIDPNRIVITLESGSLKVNIHFLYSIPEPEPEPDIFTNTVVFQNRNIVRFDGTIIADMESIVNNLSSEQLTIDKQLPLINGEYIQYPPTSSDNDWVNWYTEVVNTISPSAYVLYYTDTNGTKQYLKFNNETYGSDITETIGDATVLEIKTNSSGYQYFYIPTSIVIIVPEPEPEPEPDIVTYSTDASGVKTATFSGSGQLTEATDQLNGATVAIIEGYSSIGDQAFRNATNLTSVTIPTSVSSIGQGAFQFTTSLTSITVNQPNQYYKDISGVLYDLSGATLIQYPLGNTRTIYTIPEGVTSIGYYAFEYVSSLTTITIPVGITSIGEYAFVYSSLTTVWIHHETVSVLNTNTGATLPLNISQDVRFYGVTVTNFNVYQSIIMLNNDLLLNNEQHEFFQSTNHATINTKNYKITPSITTTYNVFTTGNTDTYIRIYQESSSLLSGTIRAFDTELYSEIKYNDDYNYNTNANLTFTAQANTAYVVSFGCFKTNTGSTTLNIQQV
jgi:hypothetical protein